MSDTTTWQPARPGDTPGALVPGEGDTVQEPQAREPLAATYGSPELRPTYDEDGETQNPLDCGWDLAFGCNLSVGHQLAADTCGPDLTLPLEITVHTSDAHARAGHTTRQVTADQVEAFGQMLVNLARSVRAAGRG